MTDKRYDVVIVGAGIAGAIMAKTLANAGYQVLILEAGLQAGADLQGNEAYLNYQSYLDRFYLANAKVPNAPYPNLKDAPSPNVLDLAQINGTTPDTNGYFVQNGPLPFASDYARTPGGTTLHWLGTCLRMLPNDFKMKTVYDQGVDWPISYDDLKPYYEMAEREIGVSGDVNDQQLPGTGKDYWGPDYVFPMHKIPQSYLDHKFTEGVEDMTVRIGAQEYDMHVISTPQGRNSVPNRHYHRVGPVWEPARQKLVLEYNQSASYEPVGSVWDPYTGQRCEGNASCVPICPVQAKYNALKTLKSAPQGNVKVITQAVASELEIDTASGRITGVTYKRYKNPNSPEHTTETARGTIYVVAAHAVETAKLLLASGACRTSDQVGRNLMDHAVFLTWGSMPEKVYPYRGPGSTSNIPAFRDGEFRKDFSAFILPIDNWGWSWPTGAPQTNLTQAISQMNMFGKQLRNYLADSLPRQLLVHFECEQLPVANNRVTIDAQYQDQLGNYRPVIQYDVSDYTRAAFPVAVNITNQMFARMGVQNFTQFDPTNPDYLIYNGSGYVFYGAGHLVGTHRMGFSASDSVVNRDQRAWDHDNLYLVGCGNMPTIGTSNPTLTMSALAFAAAENILRDLK
ncbi:MAG TPA: GMC family oxidoreductase [Blastocatellia bacterium]|nr:GMC family oxidoreductase [Blastocatellia bacterium]